MLRLACLAIQAVSSTPISSQLSYATSRLNEEPGAALVLPVPKTSLATPTASETAAESFPPSAAQPVTATHYQPEPERVPLWASFISAPPTPNSTSSRPPGSLNSSAPVPTAMSVDSQAGLAARLPVMPAAADSILNLADQQAGSYQNMPPGDLSDVTASRGFSVMLQTLLSAWLLELGWQIVIWITPYIICRVSSALLFSMTLCGVG